MRLIESFRKRKLVLFNVFLSLYIGINFIGGERGLISYFEKNERYQSLIKEKNVLNDQLSDLKHKINLIKNNDLDYLDMLYREKFKFGTKNELIIKLK